MVLRLAKTLYEDEIRPAELHSQKKNDAKNAYPEKDITTPVYIAERHKSL